jgi:hypothetical protein
MQRNVRDRTNRWTGGLGLTRRPSSATKKCLQLEDRSSSAAGLVWGLEVLRYEEGWTEQGRHEARLVARGRHAGLDRGAHDRTRAPNKA